MPSYMFSCIRGMSTLKGNKIAHHPFCKGVYSERKEFIPLVSLFFPFREVDRKGGDTGITGRGRG